MPENPNPLTPPSAYPVRRTPVLARNMVATSQPLAAQAGLQALQRGGNAVDAALAAAIALAVVEPTSNGIGGDAFAILWDGSRLHGLNASGRSPAGLTRERFAGQDKIPERGWDAVTVPGAVSAWVELSQRFGRLPFEELFEAGIRYAREGFPVGPQTAQAWARSARVLGSFEGFRETFMPSGRVPAAGEIFRSEAHARTLELIAQTRGEAFYRGELAGAMASHAAKTGGLLSEEDLASHEPFWSDTIGKQYGGVELHEIPPNGQGLAASIALGILEHVDLARHEVDSAEALHLQIEAMKLAFADAYRYIADPAAMEIDYSGLLAKEYLASRAALIDPARAQDPGYGTPPRAGTVYLSAADQGGMMVSFIQSNFQGFGSGIVVPGTGIALQNRGAGFTLEEGHPNVVAGSKLPYHTIIPGFLMRDGMPLGSFGVMGGFMQPQGHMQLVVRLETYGQDPQAAMDAPRWQVLEGLKVAVEEEVGQDVIQELRARGHDVEVDRSPYGKHFFGGGQLIVRSGEAYVGVSDFRREGQAVGF